MVNELNLKNSQGEKLAGILHKSSDKKFVMIYCHGFPGSKDRDQIGDFCNGLESAGINAFRFDFAGSGASEGEFREGTTSKQIADLKSVVDYFVSEGYEVGLVGHSRGGMTVVLEASMDDRIKLVISVSGSMDTQNFINRIFPWQAEKIRNDEIFYWWEEKHGKRYPVTPDMIKDLETHEPCKAVKKITCPILFVHGLDDANVLPEESQSTYREANEPKKIKLYERADHCFRDKKVFQQMLKDCISWIKEQIDD